MDKIFANGIRFVYPKNGSPDFIIGKLSINKSELIPFLDSQVGDWVNLDIKKSKKDTIYLEVNTWKKEVKNNIPDVAPSTKDDLPF